VKKSFLLGAVAIVSFVGCSEMGDPVDPQFDDICYIRACYDAPSVVAVPGTITLGSTQVIGFVVDGRLLDANSVRHSMQFRLTGVSFESDTVPGPLPPGPIEQIVRTQVGQAAIKEIFALADDDGGPAPSDTVPGPGPSPGPAHTIVWDFNTDGVNDVLVLGTTKYLESTKRLSFNTAAYRLSTNTGFTSALVGVSVVAEGKSFGK
jgi:hypothetical protein